MAFNSFVKMAKTYMQIKDFMAPNFPKHHLDWEARHAVLSQPEAIFTTAHEAAVHRLTDLAAGKPRFAHVCVWEQKNNI